MSTDPHDPAAGVDPSDAASQPAPPPEVTPWALAYARAGWQVLPVPFATKNPNRRNWQRERVTPEEVPARFGPGPTNIGLLTGAPSGWIVDVDLDHPRCVALADDFLPATPAVFGRPGNPRSHRLYRVTSPASTKQHRSKSAGMLVEMRSTTHQTMIPPSVHPSGEQIAWDGDWTQPTEVDPETLLAAVQKLADTVRIELGERPTPKPKAPRDKSTAKPDRKAQRLAQRVHDCVAAMSRMRMQDHNDGSSRLFAAACRVVEHDLDDASGVAALREYAQRHPFPREWSDDDLRQRIHDAERKVERGIIPREPRDSGKIKIVIDSDEHRVVNETLDALQQDETIFQRGGALVRVVREHSSNAAVRCADGAATITLLPQATLRERMTRYIDFTQFAQRKETVVELAVHPPTWLVAAVDSRGEYPGIRPLTAVSDVPVLRPDGTLCQEPGYDERTRVLYEPSEEFPHVPTDAGHDDAREALQELLEVVCDFQFESDDHKAAWVAALLTPLARFAFDGPAPLFLIDANVRGAGKGLLAQTIGQIVLGREMPVSSYAHDPEEMRKKITTIAIAGDRLVHLDNLEGAFGNDTLDRALTSTRWKDRVLGRNEQVDLPLVAVWYGTGNNVSVAADTTRRIIHIRLDVLEERPEDRSGFVHPELLTWVRSQRQRLLMRALTILVAYVNTERPTHDLTPFGSFEGWSRLVREAVVWLGLPDPCNTRTRLVESADATADSLAQLMDAWATYDPHGEGVVVAHLLARLYSREGQLTDDASVVMRAALENLVGCPPGKTPTARQVGNKLRHHRRRVLGDRYLDINPKEQSRQGAVWRLHVKATQDAEATAVRVCDSASPISNPLRERRMEWADC